MTKEIWRDIEGYEGLYQVSDQGRVKSLKRKFIDKIGRERYVEERVLKLGMNKCGYQVVNLYTGGKQKKYKVHRLVCQAFHENTNNKPQVNHINEIKTDNRACNLEWATAKQNCNHGTHNARMAETKSKPVCQYTLHSQLIKVWQSTSEVERKTGFSRANISRAANGKYKQSHGYIWKYIEVVE